MLPAIFVSHGAPTLPLDACPAREFLQGLGQTLPRPRAIIAVSAHWETDAPAVSNVAVNSTIHDFYGFPEALYRMQYPAPGAPELAARVTSTLAASGFRSDVDSARGLDHGAWVPLMLMYPDAGIPTIQLSVQTRLGTAHHVKLGQALAKLRDDDILVLGSGGYTHNLRTLSRGNIAAAEPAWAHDFSEWVGEALTKGRTQDLIEYRRRAPYAAQAHPSEEHFLPLFMALGAGGEGAKAKRLHTSTTFGSLRMDAYAFG
jgi:4,5-DOPA dioxygenase extradiol